MQIHICKAATDSDIEFVAKHFEETVSLWEDYSATEKSIAARVESVKKWLDDDNAHVTVAIADDGQILGFNTLWIFDGYSGEKLGKICILYVLPEFRGQAVAKQLKDEGEEWMRSKGAIAVITEIDAKNKRMLTISKKAGFAIKSYVLQKKL